MYQINHFTNIYFYFSLTISSTCHVLWSLSTYIILFFSHSCSQRTPSTSQITTFKGLFCLFVWVCVCIFRPNEFAWSWIPDYLLEDRQISTVCTNEKVTPENMNCFQFFRVDCGLRSSSSYVMGHWQAQSSIYFMEVTTAAVDSWL